MATVIPASDFNVELVPGIAKDALSAAGAKAVASAVHMIPVGALRVIDGFNVRVTGTKDYESGIAELTNSILSEGFYKDKPLVGYAGKDGEESVIYLTDGHRRLEAVKKAIAGGANEIEAVPVIVKPASTNMVDLTVALAKTGTALSPYELSIIVKRLIGYGADESMVAQRLGVTKRYVSDLMVLQGAPTKVRNMVMGGQVSATLAIQALREDPAAAEKKLAEAVKVAKSLGLDRATNKHVGAAPRTGGKPANNDGEPAERATHKNPKPGKAGNFKLTIKGKAGDKLKMTEISLFAGVQKGAWYTPAEDGKTVVLTQAINLKITGTFGDTVAPVEPAAPDAPKPDSEGL